MRIPRGLAPVFATSPEPLEARIAPAFASVVSAAGLDGSNGFRFSGESSNNFAGVSVSAAGDVNGDGTGDLIIGASGAAGGSGAAYVVFGGVTPAGANFDLSSLNGTNGFKIKGINQALNLGLAVSEAGDVNGDGIGDLIVGAPGGEYSGVGFAYVIFGKNSGFATTLEVAALSGGDGFRIEGTGSVYDYFGSAVSSAGDINGDGFDDVVIGAFGVDGQQGEAYVVFGKREPFGPKLSTSSLNGSNGFRMIGGASLGRSVDGAGDINGDGLEDLIIGAPGSSAGSSYVLFGKRTAFAAEVDFGGLPATDGFEIRGAENHDESGEAVSGAGDINGDGLAELIIGASHSSPHGKYSGATFVVFGKRESFGKSLNLADLNGTGGFRINGADADDQTGLKVNAAGDVNGDGVGDLMIGARSAGSGNKPPGATYVVFGKTSGFAAALELSALNGTNGFKVVGASGDDNLGASLAPVGDLKRRRLR